MRRMSRRIREALAVYSKLGAVLKDVSLPNVPLSVPTYYVVAPAECSSNLARFDGVRFGHRCERAARSAGPVSPLARRRIRRRGQAPYHDRHLRALGRLLRCLLSEGAEGAAADRQGFSRRLRRGRPADGARRRRRRHLRLGAKTADPVTMYLNDIYTIGANLAGLPAISIPCGFVTGLPVGLQLIGPHFAEAAC